jgi:glycerol-3-phosphate dehydrogenase
MPSSTSDRQQKLDNLARSRFDIIVIGGGINGTGIARDAAMRGLRVLLLEKGDLGEGTTAWSTRLIHGGLRYLEYYEVPLVRESLREREILFRNAPHLVRPLPFLVPIYQGAKRAPWLIRMGMMAYDTLSYDRSVPGHQMLSPEQTIQQAPGINSHGLRGAAVYYDGQVTFPERISVENALSAADYGATVLTYTRVDGVSQVNNRVTGVTFTDLLNEKQASYTVRAPLTINVTGPWVDRLVNGVDVETPQYIGGTKGSHIIVESFPGAPDSAIYVENEVDSRPYFIVPWNGLYLIGTTDFRYTGDLDRVIADDDEIDYLIADTNRVIPGAGLAREHVRYTYSGVRPLPHVEEGSESGITRKHLVHDHAPEILGLISIIGGKLTTYRNLAEQATDMAFRKLGRAVPECSTATVPFPGANTSDFDRYAREFTAWSGLDQATATRLVSIYGTLSRTIVERSRLDPELLNPLPGAPATIRGEIPYAFDFEAAQTLTDVLMRRMMIGLDADNGMTSLETAGAIAAEHNAWDSRRLSQELEQYRKYLERFRSQALVAAAGAVW